MGNEVNWISLISIILASIGALLGIINTSYLVFKDRIRLKLRIRMVIMAQGHEVVSKDLYCLEVTNLSFIPVTVKEVGFLLPGKSGQKIPFVFQPAPGSKLPHRLEARASVSVYSTKEETDGINQMKCDKAYLKTDCGKFIRVKL